MAKTTKDYFTMQSYLHSRPKLLQFPALAKSSTLITRSKQRRILIIYGALYALATILVFAVSLSGSQAFGLGLIFPGTGYLLGWKIGSLTLPLFLFLGTAILFLASLVLWFATGNVILPPAIWLVSAFCAAFLQRHIPIIDTQANPIIWVLFGIVPISILILSLYRTVSHRAGKEKRARLNEYLASPKAIIPHLISAPYLDELSPADLAHMRLLLDRALQPVEDFEGFEWIDQFQTSAVRYQINFISYALSLAQAQYMPAFGGYLSAAQRNLKAKQENPRIWQYWGLENLWGNLSLDGDPIKRDNIMYSGFVAMQMALTNNAGLSANTHDFGGLNCQSKNGKGFSYSNTYIIKALVAQYNGASYGLLPCEPNWVYPLCNAITATAICAHDSRHGTRYWDEIKYAFCHALETEFITPGGQFIPFRSNYTGLAASKIGGAVMQAFPSFFLNAVLPEIAERQWLILRERMDGKSWRRALWPIDVGNYQYSRASSYAATALAAREMGDHETANLLLDYLDNENPKIVTNGIAHHSKASLWANANAFMAKTGRVNGLRDLVTKPQSAAQTAANTAPYLACADYAEVLIAKAVNEGDGLEIVAYPANASGYKSLGISGLTPGAPYRIYAGEPEAFRADQDGNQTLHIPINGRTHLHISRI